MRSVIEYMEYRDFLKDFYETNKSRKPYFSFRYMESKVSIDASHLVKILQKQRHIGNDSIETFIKFCGLKRKEAEYFAALVQFNKAKTDRDSKFYYDKLLLLKGVQTCALNKNQYEFYTKWYYSAILTLLDFYSFSGDYKSLAAKLSPAISETTAKKSISLLKKLDLIRENGDGTFYLTHNLITTGKDCASKAVKTFQRETMHLASESLDRHPREKRNISTVTLTISEENMDEINELVTAFRETLLKFADNEKKPDKVYQLNIQLFPLTD